MLDNYQNIHTSNQFNYSINAVSGTLRKSHPKSRITIEVLNDKSRLFKVQPKKLTKEEAGSIWEGDYKNVIVLQTMLIGDNRAIIEYVFEEDFLQDKED